MNRKRTRLLDEIYGQALGLSGRDRLDFLDDRCGRDAGLRRAAEALLDAAEAPDDRLDRHFKAARERLWRLLRADDADAAEDLAGQCIDGWRIDEKISGGGLAIVYRARRDDVEFGRVAAFKVLRRGLDTDDVVDRFRAERQILSSLDHPSIARILDGGALADGRPFLVLEFVDGPPITAYCEKRDLDFKARVRLLIDLLGALRHVHMHQIVHRDVKPSNVLVSDEGGVVLLDFGIAKRLDAEVGQHTSAMTGSGMALLTPGYASPEQYADRAVTTASDIYQAGLMLYELLTGKRPFEGRPEDSGFSVPPPSAELQGTARHQEVHGGLDAITRKATQFDAAMRYASADDMARDLQRWIEGRPIAAMRDAFLD